MNTLTRWLEKNEITTLGRTLWQLVQVKDILRRRTYTGNRHYQLANLSDAATPKHQRKTGPKDTEMICVKVPAIISQELFDKVQAKFEQNVRRYKQPPARYLIFVHVVLSVFYVLHTGHQLGGDKQNPSDHLHNLAVKRRKSRAR